MFRMPMALTLAGSLLLAASAVASPNNHVDDVRVVTHEGRVDVVVKTRAAPTFQSFAKRSPAVVMLDVLDASAEERRIEAPKNSAISEITLSSARGNGNDVARLVVRVDRAVFYDVTADERSVTLSIFDEGTGAIGKGDKAAHSGDTLASKGEGARLAALSTSRPDVRSDAPSPRFAQASGEGGAGMSTGSGGNRAMTYVGFRNLASQSEVFARMNGQVTFDVKREGDNLLVLEIRNAVIPLDNNKNHLDATFFDSPVKMITPTEVDDASPTIRIIIEMKEDVPYRTEMRGREVTVIFQKSAG